MRVAIATNEPWGTYHLAPLLADARARGIELVQLVPDLDQVPVGLHAVVHAGDPSTVEADVLVVTGFTAWPLQCAAALPDLPLVASCLAYLNPDRAEAPQELRDRLRTVTAPSSADAASFARHLGIDVRRIQVVGTPLLDGTESGMRIGHTLVVTAVTAEAPHTSALLRDLACALHEAGHDVVIRLHPREDASAWAGFEIDPEVSARSAALGARLVVGVPGTAFAPIAATGVPLAGVMGDDMAVPSHLTALCSTVVTPATDVAAWAERAGRVRPSDPLAVLRCVGPIGGSARRLLAQWLAAAEPVVDDPEASDAPVWPVHLGA